PVDNVEGPFVRREAAVRAMILKEFRELRRDHRTVAMLVAMPILLLVIFGYAANFTIDEIPTRLIGPGATPVEAGLPELFRVEAADAGAASEDAVALLRDGVVDVVIDTSTRPPTASVDGSSLFSAQAAAAALRAAPGGTVQIDILFNPDLITAWVMVPALIGL